MRLFLSYAHVDEVRVTELIRVLSAAEFESWWDDHLEYGDDWKAELRRRITACDAFLCLISPDALESEWCQWELAQAMALSKFIVPIVVRGGTPIPGPLARLQYLDVSDGFEKRDVAKLVGGLARLKQTAPFAKSSHDNPRGFPSRFTQPLPRAYRTVTQGYLRPATPGMYRYQWPTVNDAVKGPLGRIIGIDFGTTTSSVALYQNGVVDLIPNSQGETTTPSAVAIAEDGTPLVGQRALDLLLRRPERGVVEVKRLFGREITKELSGTSFLEVDGTAYRPVDLAAFIFSRLRMDAEAHLGTRIRTAVLTAPAYFDQSQMVDLAEAARLADLDVLRVISEPVAACLGTKRRTASGRVLVYDLGGGTFDVSLVDVEAGVIEVIAVNGDTCLGGADFDRVAVDYCADEFMKATGIDLRDNATALMRLRDAVERGKIELSTAREATVSVPFVAFPPAGPLHLNVDLTRTRYNELTHDLIARSVLLTRRTLDDGQAAAPDEVLVVGRAARAPSVRDALEDLFGPRVRPAPDHVVALGAAVQAAVLEGTLKDMLLLDSVSNTLRVELAGNRSVPVIIRHTTIPTRMEVSVVANRGAHKTALIRILAGESSWADRNLALLNLYVPVGPGNNGGQAIKVTLDMDANSVLSVEAKGSGAARGSIGLRCRFTNLEAVDLAPEQAALLPVHNDGAALTPLHDADSVQAWKVQRWLVEALSNLAIRRRQAGADHEIDAKLRRYKEVQDWLRSNPASALPPEIVDWQPWVPNDTEREMLVDALEQRFRADLAPLRYCTSIRTMADQLVHSVRELREGR